MKRRLRMPLWDADSACSLCGETLDRWGEVSTESRALRGLAGDTPRNVSLRIAQRISCSLHRENARAILRRSPSSENCSISSTGDFVSGSGW